MTIMAERKRPGGELAARPLHVIWIADCSGSMAEDGKIQSLNTAIREAVPEMQAAARDNPNAQVLMRAVRFASGATWHIEQPTSVSGFTWPDLPASGTTDMGKALRLVAAAMRTPPMSDRALPPVLVLVSDGQPTDDFAAGLKALMEEPWGKKAVRLAIAIGRDADLDVLQQFIGHPEITPLLAHNVAALRGHIRWVSTAVLKAVSAPVSVTSGAGGAGGNVVLPPVPAPARVSTPAAAPADDDVW